MDIIGRFVLVRSVEAGLHSGTLLSISQDGKVVFLQDSRNLHSWEGANTFNELVNTGPVKANISEKCSEMYIGNVIQIGFPTEQSKNNLQRSRWER